MVKVTVFAGIIAVFGISMASAGDFASWRTSNGNVIQKNANAYLEAGRANILEPAELKMVLNDGNPLNDPLLLDVRFAQDYAMGRIPGAIRIAEFNEMLTEENLEKLDQALADHIAATGNDKIVVYCHLGQMSGLLTGALGTLGYNVKTLKLGYNMGWLGTGTMSPM
jgi:rhodanese-related sulfurtransferase